MNDNIYSTEEYFKVTDLSGVKNLNSNDLFLVSHIEGNSYESENVSFQTLGNNIKDTHFKDEVNTLKTINNSYFPKNLSNSFSLSNHNHGSTYSLLNHDHDGKYALLNHNHSEYSLSSHNHDGLYSKLDHKHTLNDITDYVTPPSSYENLSVTNLSSDEISAKTIYTDDIIIKNFKPVDLSKAQRKTKIVTGVNWDLTLENDYPIVYFPNLNQNEYDFSALQVSDKELDDGVYTWELICKSSNTVANITVGDSENIKYVGTDLEEGKINGEQFDANTTVVFAVRLIKYNDTNIWNINYCYKF